MSDSGREWPSEARRTTTVGKECRALCNPDEPFAKFSIACEACGEVLFEFVHQQQAGSPRWANEHMIFAQPVPAQPAAFSWFKPLMKIVCTSLDGFGHYLVPVRDGENRNMVGKSKPMTAAAFREWMEQNPVFPNKPEVGV